MVSYDKKRLMSKILQHTALISLFADIAATKTVLHGT